jgi:hypothetical protein
MSVITLDAQTAQPQAHTNRSRSRLLAATLAAHSTTYHKQLRSEGSSNNQVCALQLAGSQAVVVTSGSEFQLTEVALEPPDSVIYDSAFTVLSPGLSGVNGTVSFESINQPGTYITDNGPGNLLTLTTPTSANAATFTVVSSMPEQGMSVPVNFQSVNTPANFITFIGNGLLLLSDAPSTFLWSLIPSLALSVPLDWSAVNAQVSGFAAAVQQNPQLMSQFLDDPGSVFPQFFKLNFQDEQLGILWAGLLQLYQADTLRQDELGGSVACWGCRTAIGITFAAWGGAMVVALGGFPALATSGGFLSALGTALGVELGTLSTVLSTASAATSFVSFVDTICKNIPSSPCS